MAGFFKSAKWNVATWGTSRFLEIEKVCAELMLSDPWTHCPHSWAAFLALLYLQLPYCNGSFLWEEVLQAVSWSGGGTWKCWPHRTREVSLSIFPVFPLSPFTIPPPLNTHSHFSVNSNSYQVWVCRFSRTSQYFPWNLFFSFLLFGDCPFFIYE